MRPEGATPTNGFANRCIAPAKKPDRYSFCSGVKLSEPTGEMDAMTDALCSEMKRAQRVNRSWRTNTYAGQKAQRGAQVSDEGAPSHGMVRGAEGNGETLEAHPYCHAK